MERRSILFAQLRYQRCTIEKLSSLFQTVSLRGSVNKSSRTFVNKGKKEEDRGP